MINFIIVNKKLDIQQSDLYFVTTDVGNLIRGQYVIRVEIGAFSEAIYFFKQ